MPTTREKRAANDPRWADDTSLSWDEYGAGDEYGVGHLIADDAPDNPRGDVLAVTAKLWPCVHPAAQESRP